MPVSRAPKSISSPYISGHGYTMLETEIKALWNKRSVVTQALSAAAAEGDRSENAEYIYRKKELRAIDKRIRYLQKRMPALKIVSRPPEAQNKIYFGAQVRLANQLGEETIYRIVGPDEIDPGKSWISMDSPMARSLLTKQVDDEIFVETPKGRDFYTVIEISYPAWEMNDDNSGRNR